MVIYIISETLDTGEDTEAIVRLVYTDQATANDCFRYLTERHGTRYSFEEYPTDTPLETIREMFSIWKVNIYLKGGGIVAKHAYLTGFSHVGELEEVMKIYRYLERPQGDLRLAFTVNVKADTKEQAITSGERLVLDFMNNQLHKEIV